MSNVSDYINKPWNTMTDDEIRGSHAYWIGAVEKAAGWSSAYFAAKCLASAQQESNRRGLGLTNPHPIKKG